jgi:hypothetical protein
MSKERAPIDSPYVYLNVKPHGQGKKYVFLCIFRRAWAANVASMRNYCHLTGNGQHSM